VAPLLRAHHQYDAGIHPLLPARRVLCSPSMHRTETTLRRKRPMAKLDIASKEYFLMKERLQINERMLLLTIGCPPFLPPPF